MLDVLTVERTYWLRSVRVAPLACVPRDHLCTFEKVTQFFTVATGMMVQLLVKMSISNSVRINSVVLCRLWYPHTSGAGDLKAWSPRMCRVYWP